MHFADTLRIIGRHPWKSVVGGERLDQDSRDLGGRVPVVLDLKAKRHPMQFCPVGYGRHVAEDDTGRLVAMST
jgi:hypothetical protein